MFPRAKLVRDLVNQQGRWDRKVVFRKAEDKEYADLLADKVLEEAGEVRQDMLKKNRDGVVAELADLAEVTTEVMRFYKITTPELCAAVDKKAAERGTFKDRLVLTEYEERKVEP